MADIGDVCELMKKNGFVPECGIKLAAATVRGGYVELF